MIKGGLKYRIILLEFKFHHQHKNKDISVVNPFKNQPSPELFIAISNTRYTRLGTIKYKDSSVVAPVESIKKY